MKFLLLLCLLHIVAYATYAQNWQTFYQRADSLMQRRDFKNSIPLYEQALPLAENLYGKNHENYLNIRNGLGRSMTYISEKEKILSFLVENIELCKKYGEKTIFYAQALYNIGTFYLPNLKGNNPTQSEYYLIQSLNLRKEILGNKHPDYLQSLNNLAVLYRNIGKYTAAEQLYKETLQTRKEILGIKHPDYLVSLNNLAALYYFINNYLAAEALYKEALEIRKEVLGTKHPDYVQSLNNLAVLYMDLGNYVLAEIYYKEALQIRKEVVGTKHSDYTQSLNNLALLYWNMGKYSAAIILFQECLALKKEIAGKKDVSYANTLINLARLYRSIGSYELAETTYKEVLQIQKEVLGEKHSIYATSLNNFAVLYKEMGKYQQAKVLLTQALQIYAATTGTKSIDYARSLTNLSELYRDLGFYSRADSLAKEKYEINKATANMSLFWSHNVLGTIQSKQQRYAEAEENLLKGTALLEKMQVSKGLDGTRNQQDLALLYWQTQQEQKAAPLFLGIRKNTINLSAENFPSMSATEKENFWRGLKKHVEYFNSFAVGQKLHGELYDLQLFSKGILLNATQKMRNRILASQDSVLIREADAWTTLKLSIAKYRQTPQEELAKTAIKLDSLENTANNMERELSKKSEAFATLADKKLVTWQDIQKKLKRREAAVEIIRINKFGIKKMVTDSSAVLQVGKLPEFPLYDLTDTVYYAALIIKKKSKEPELVLLTNGNELEGNAFNYYRNTILYKVHNKQSYNLYWKAIQDKLGKVKKVYLSPDGVYNKLNINVLQNPVTKRYVVDDMSIQQVTNTKELLSFRFSSRLENRATAKLFGRPAYTMDSVSYFVNLELNKDVRDNYALRSSVNLQRGNFADLKGTEQEVNNIDSLLSRNNVITQKYLLTQATERKVKSVQNPTILHIATHGFFFEEEAQHQDPMLNSGVLLAGVTNYFRSAIKTEVEDGVLTAQEAQNLSLDKTDLVVLSACETGLGEIRNGEGVYGLQRAFKVAGAKSILMSHWKVSDDATKELMTLFYKYWVETKDKRKAFSKAQKTLREKYPHPFHWGAFVLVGE